jgi:dihydrofolate synthase/folylpolyglutamate synthase
MTYKETIDFMFAQLPMYHRIGAAAYKNDIQPTLDMMAALGNPERKFKSIHVAGTNGKGSVSHFLASILQEAGLKVGLYTSPHLVDFRERIRINGEMIPEQAVVDFITRKLPACGGNLVNPGNGFDKISQDFEGHDESLKSKNNLQDFQDLAKRERLSFFEMTVGLAFDYFAREQVDIAVIEVGMGGRLDSTNVITPLLSIITNIGLDHTQFLGDTLEKIAAEKAGIIKEGVPVVIGETQPETKPVFEAVAAAHHAPITFADEHYRVDRIEDYTTELTGEYQKKNIATVLQAVDILRDTFNFQLSTFHLQRGLAHVVTNTHLRGRWEKIGKSPLTICETAHNEPGIRAMLPKLSEILKQSSNQTIKQPHLHLIYGCVNDKDFRHILQLLTSQLSTFHFPLSIYFTQPSVPRRLPVADLAAAAHEMGIDGPSFDTVQEAIAAARAAADPEDLVLVTGSIFLVADALS